MTYQKLPNELPLCCRQIKTNTKQKQELSITGLQQASFQLCHTNLKALTARYADPQTADAVQLWHLGVRKNRQQTVADL